MNWPFSTGARSELLGVSTGSWTTITSGTANNKGSAASLGTASFRYDAFMLGIYAAAANARTYRLDIIVNNGGSDQIIVEDFYFDGTGVALQLYFPIAIPEGAVVIARLQANAGSNTISVALTGFAYGWGDVVGASRAISCTDWSNTLPANIVTQTGQTATAWTEIIASTPAAVSHLYIMPSHAGDNTRTDSQFQLDIAAGAAGSEQIIASFPGHQSSGVVDRTPWEIGVNLPAATRLSFRVTCANAGAADSMGMTAVGLAA